MIFEIFILYNIHFSHITSQYNKKNKRKTRKFNFWEPRQKIPGYIQLCLNTWKKFLPEYEIIILVDMIAFSSAVPFLRYFK